MTLIVVKKKAGESDEKLIARFRKKVLFEGIIPEARERKFFKSGAEKRKERKYRIKHLREIEKKREY